MPDPTGASPTPSTAEKAWDDFYDSQIGKSPLVRDIFLGGYAAAEAHYAPLVEAAGQILNKEWQRASDDLADALRAIDKAARQTAKEGVDDSSK